jgi:hypothetical protein
MLASKEPIPVRVRVFLALLVAVLMIPAVAQAKGPDQATIDGTGMAVPVSISGIEGAAGDLSTLVEVAGLFPAAFGQTPDPMLATAPDEVLGPKLSITWRVPDGDPTASIVRQDLYLYAAGGPLTYTAPGQPFLGSQRTRGGWFRTPATLRSRWAVFGLPTGSALEAAARPTAALSSRPSSRDGRPPWPLIAVITGGVVGAVALTTFRFTTRRRGRLGAT